MAFNSAGPPVSTGGREVARTYALAQLRQAFWEASQFFGRDKLENFSHSVLDEIETDEP